MSRKQKNRDT